MRAILLACILLLTTVPAVAAEEPSAANAFVPICFDNPGLVDKAQCLINHAIDSTEAQVQSAIRTACDIVFGEPC